MKLLRARRDEESDWGPVEIAMSLGSQRPSIGPNGLAPQKGGVTDCPAMMADRD